MSSQQPGRHHTRATTDLGEYNDVPAPLLGSKADFNADFASQFPSGKRTSTGKSYKDEANQPILQGTDDNYDPNRRPTTVTGRAKTMGVTTAPSTSIAPGSAVKQSATRNFFGMGMGGSSKATTGITASANMMANTDDYYGIPSNEEKKTTEYKAPITIGKRKIAVWPYDDYHLVQKMYYEKLQESALYEQQQQTHRLYRPRNQLQLLQQSQSTPLKSPKQSKTPEAKEAKEKMEQEQASLPIFSRPADPPDIPTAVQGLSLTAFEEKAEERAITIVSTWLFDSELIDELLANGGMTGKMIVRYATVDNKEREDGTFSVGDDSNDNRSVKTSEGIEVGSNGYPLEGSTKMDKEIAKLRNSTKRQLALINARLNDGVVATGGEVQELVNAVIATKDDIGRLRELSTYISNNSDVEKTSRFMLNNYPKLKEAINARRNIARVFRELDFFASIPGTCERLREELSAGEWTAHEWSSLRTVTREHCDLEIFLVEAEAEMKKRLQEEQTAERERADAHIADANFNRMSFRNVMSTTATTTGKQALMIDRFLEEHVRNVWELGEEIRLRIMSGIANAFELASNNPAGMVALVEAVEVYESANEDYMAIYGERAGVNRANAKLRFTDMRAAAIAELYKDFESRCFEVFQELTGHAADILAASSIDKDKGSSNDEEDSFNRSFSAVLRAAHKLAMEIDVVRGQMAPCFPPNWHIAALWTTCVAHVCSNNILQQLGGPEGQRLSELNVTQMLDLVAWVENFRETISEIFPNLDDLAAAQGPPNSALNKKYFNKPIKLLVENSKIIDMKLAQDSLIWVNNTLWSVHDLAKDEFLYRTKEQTETWLTNVYNDEHNKAQTSEGRLITSLCEDVYSLAAVQIRTIRERLTRRSEALVQAVGVVLRHLYEKQTTCRDRFCTDFETCCAAANDFLRMSDKCEEIIDEIKRESKISPAAENILDEQAAALLTLYSGDAVFAAKKTHMYCFQPIEEAIAKELFSTDWEQELSHNELALTLVRTLDDFMEDLETFLDELMVTRAVEAQISSSVNFYLKCLLKKSSTNSKKSIFTSNELAIRRMRGDSQVMRDYFDGLAESMPTLTRIVENEFSFLEAIFELISIAAGISKSDAQDFILILQKRVKNIYITKLVVGDLWHLVNPAEERDIYDVIDGMEDTLNAVAPIDEKAIQIAKARETVPGLRMDEMMAKHVDDDKRRRPMLPEALKKAEGALRGWRWGRKDDKAATPVAAISSPANSGTTSPPSGVYSRSSTGHHLDEV